MAACYCFQSKTIYYGRLGDNTECTKDQEMGQILSLGPTLYQTLVISVGWSQELCSKKITGEVQSLVQRSLLEYTRQQHQQTVGLVLGVN